MVPHDMEKTDARAFRILRFTRIVMGLTSRPFDLNAVLRHHYDNCLTIPNGVESVRRRANSPWRTDSKYAVDSPDA